MTLNQLLYLNWKKLLLILSLYISFVVLHNTIYALTDKDEPIFFMLAIFVIPFYFIFAVVYSIFSFFKKKLKPISPSRNIKN
jgi:hypothetical protein